MLTTSTHIERTIAEIWRDAEALRRRIDAHEFPEPEASRQFHRLTTMEDAVRRGSIRSGADALAKLKAAGLSFERGLRTDDTDGPAFADAVHWLEAMVR